MTNDDSVNLENLLNEEITVHLKGGQALQGILKKVDDYMNMILKDVKEEKRDGSVKEYDIVVVKGGNAKTITKSN